MCRADLSIRSWYWKGGDYTTPWPTPKVERLCTDFDEVLQWLAPHGPEKNEGLLSSHGVLSLNETGELTVFELA